jgi:GNAT superfamily N-acetyltransferase
VGIEVRPATLSRFADVAAVLGPRNPTASVCWCLSHRLDSRTNRALVGPARGDYVRGLCGRAVAPGVLAYDLAADPAPDPAIDDGEAGTVVGWAAVAPRSELPFARSRTIPRVDDLPVWSVWCIRVRPGHRGKGISHALLAGAVDYARSHGAPAVEGYPVDNQGRKVDLTMAYVGTRALFERAGFTKAADTGSVSGGFPRVLMRLPLP